MIGEGKKLRLIMYGPLRIVDKIGTNAFHLDILSYMYMYSVINIENLKLWAPSMIMDEVDSYSSSYN